MTQKPVILFVLAAAFGCAAPAATSYRAEYRGDAAGLAGPADRSVQAASLPTASSGPAGTTVAPPNTILFHQVGLRGVDGACELEPFGDPGIPTPFQGVCFRIEAINGFARPVRDLHAMITSMTYLGPTAGGTVVTYVKAPSDPSQGLDNTLGLWNYGRLTPAGSDNDRRIVNWYFYTTDPGAAAQFRFIVQAMGDVAGP